jgi:hypothetical protein
VVVIPISTPFSGTELDDPINRQISISEFQSDVNMGASFAPVIGLVWSGLVLVWSRPPRLGLVWGIPQTMV